MDTLLSAVHSERERQRKRLAILGKIERLARKLDVDQASGHPEPARRARRERHVRPGRATSRSRSRPNPSGADIASFIAKHGPVGRAEINRALGGDLNSLDGHLKRLTGKGTIDVEGERPHRRYRAPNARRPPEVLAASESRSSALTPAPAAVASCTGAEDLLALISEHAPVTTARLREVTGLGYQEIIDWGRILARRRAVSFEGEGPERTWRPKAERDLSAEVMAMIVAEPAVHNEHRLTLALRASYESVSSVCADLLDRDAISLTESNTYVPVAAPLISTGAA